jgi:hypothetical protein
MLHLLYKTGKLRANSITAKALVISETKTQRFI